MYFLPLNCSTVNREFLMSRRTTFASLGTTPQEPPINITPLIDVVFVVLIAFIVIAPLLEIDRIELASGEGLHIPARAEDSDAIKIHVLENNRIFVNTNPVLLQELAFCLSKVKKQFPQARVQLLQHKRAHFGTYQAVKNALESAGFKELDVVLVPS
jgi:biopolymer transport protein ExbD